MVFLILYLGVRKREVGRVSDAGDGFAYISESLLWVVVNKCNNSYAVVEFGKMFNVGFEQK